MFIRSNITSYLTEEMLYDEAMAVHRDSIILWVLIVQSVIVDASCGS